MGVILSLGEPRTLLGLALYCGGQAPQRRGDSRWGLRRHQRRQRRPPKHFYTTKITSR